jgi:formylglycine-generating enzyme required for sulfatase activity
MNANAAAGRVYTLVLGDDISSSKQTLSRANIDLTIIGLGGLKTITYTGPEKECLFSTYNATVSAKLKIGENIKCALTALAPIPAGTFLMGCPPGEPGRTSRETDQHSVTLAGFRMGKYEVTQELYQLVMGSNPSASKSPLLPVETVTWLRAIEFCNKLSVMEGLDPVYPAISTTVAPDWNKNGYRLPTEAEWERACRANTQTAFNCGTTGYTAVFDYNAIVEPLGWWGDMNTSTVGNSGSKTHEVGQKNHNDFGLYDMHGNVWEWVWDWYGLNYSTDLTGPAAADSGTGRVNRGGGYADNPANWQRSAVRTWGGTGSSRDIGIRVVRNAE